MRLIPKFQRDALDVAEANGRWPWYFYGPAGRGKTFLAAALFRHWAASSFVTWFYASEILPVYTTDRDTAHRIRNTVRDTSLLVLDDVGVREPTGAQLDALLLFLNLREGKPLVVTGNCNHEELQKVLDDRCSSRIDGGQSFEVKGDDRRLNGATLFEI